MSFSGLLITAYEKIIINKTRNKNNILKAGHVWDFDWSALSMRNDCQLNRALYYDALFKSRTFRDAVKTIWAEKESLLNIPAKTRELKNLIDIAWEFDVLRWGIHKDSTRTRFESLDGNISYLQEILTNKIHVVHTEITSL